MIPVCDDANLNHHSVVSMIPVCDDANLNHHSVVSVIPVCDDANLIQIYAIKFVSDFWLVCELILRAFSVICERSVK
jgi:hypothetical protein